MLITNHHQLRHKPGTDARNHIVRCSYGWAYSSTFLAVRARGSVHQEVFATELDRWDNPRRQTQMPFYHPNHN
jgi:hypothetical protein